MARLRSPRRPSPTSFRFGRRPLLASSALAGWVGALFSRRAEAQGAAKADLGGPDRYLTALSTDKPIYRPGDPIYVRGVMLHAFRRTPIPEAAAATVEIRGPKGDVVAGGSVTAAGGVWAFSWRIPAEQPGGTYTIRASYPFHGHAPAERAFDVRAFRAPRFRSQIVFLRDGYGPGDKVTATLSVKRAEGGVPAGARVTATALVDGAEAARVPGTVDAKGLCTVTFDLPKAIARGEGTLAFAIEDGGVVDSASKTIPILLQTLDLAFYAEGGSLVAGVPNRVYFEARTPSRKPADLRGAVVDGSGREVARASSLHEGRGWFELTPSKGTSYELRVDEPSGIRTTFPLPTVVSEGVALRAATNVTPPGAPVRLVLTSPRERKVTVTLAHREVELASRQVALRPGAREEIVLNPKGADGVLVATVWGEGGEPVAERLVFRKPGKALKIELSTNRKRYTPGDGVVLTARATRGGKPVAATIGLTVTDDAVLELVEKREQAPALPVMVLLEPEVRELADAHVYLDARNAKADDAVDLLLGTQGWRRFAVMRFSDVIARYGDQARRALAFRTPPPPPPPTFMHRRMIPMGRGAAFGGARGRAVGGMPGAVMEREEAGMPMAAPMPAPMPAMAAPPAAMAPNRAASMPARQAVAQEARRDEDKAARAMPAAPPPPPAKKAKADPFFAEEAAADVAEERPLRRARKPVLQPMPGRHDFVPVREYAHAARPGRTPTDRVDFTETLYFHAGLTTNAETGEATVRFALNDSVTSFRVLAGGFDAGGALGSATTVVNAVQPFYAEAKLPLEVTVGDRIALPVNLVNGTNERLRDATFALTLPAGFSAGKPPFVELPANERVRRIVDVEVKAAAARVQGEVELEARAGGHSDRVVRKISVKPGGFPVEVAFGGLVAKGRTVSHALTIPGNVVGGSIETSVAVYPTPLANLTQALARLIRDPYGCFEQTSSTTYPLTMAQQYFLSHTGVDPKLVATAQEKLDAGYKRLAGFECTEKGYEWFGENPGHEALTAFGLLHFTDMAKVREVDRTMITRTRDWLLRQRDGKGGFSRKRRALHTWIEDQDCSNGYILWALLEGGERKGIEAELAAFRPAAAKSGNSYVTALGANVLALAGDKTEARALMTKLASKQDKTGQVTGATTSIVGSGGDALTIETTALAVLAWLRDPSFADAAMRSMKFLADSCQDGRYGSTQSTVLALRAIVAYDQAHARPKGPGSLSVRVDGKVVGAPVRFDGDTQGAIVLPDLGAAVAGPGEHRVELVMEGGSEMPYSMAVKYHALTPPSSPACAVSLDVTCARKQVAEGDPLEVLAKVTNRTKAPVPNPIAIIGLPGGVEPRHDQLKELVKRGSIASFEVIGREVVLYWRSLEAGQEAAVPISALAAVPGTYTGPASRTYLYYTDEHKSWVDGLEISIAPKG